MLKLLEHKNLGDTLYSMVVCYFESVIESISLFLRMYRNKAIFPR